MNNILEITDKSVLICDLKLTSKDIAEGHISKTKEPVLVTFYQVNLEAEIMGVEIYIGGQWFELSNLACDYKELEKDINILLESQNEWYN